MSANRDIKFDDNNLNHFGKNERSINKQQNKNLKEKELNHRSGSDENRGNTNPSQNRQQRNESNTNSNAKTSTNINITTNTNTNVRQLQSNANTNVLKNDNGKKVVGNTSNVLPDSTSASSTAATAAKIDSDLVNVANENRVILNVGGIRHETYKVSFLLVMQLIIYQRIHFVNLQVL